MKALRKLLIAVIIPVLGIFLIDLPVYAWSIAYEGVGEEITKLADVGNIESYEVKEKDTLWGIAEEKMGSGSSYRELAEANGTLIENPDLIFPGMVLQLPRGGISLKGSGPEMDMDDCRFLYPMGWTVGYIGVEETWANFALMGDGMEYIACLILDKENFMVQSTKNWAACCERIRNYVKAEYPDEVSDLTFQHYQTEEGEEVYLYSYIHEIDLEEYGLEGRYPVNVCMGIHLTEHIQAQFLGFSNDEKIKDQVLYAAGTFKEIRKPEKPLEETSNMAIEPMDSWELSGMFNPFPWVDKYYNEVLKEVLDIPKEHNIRDKFLERVG